MSVCVCLCMSAGSINMEADMTCMSQQFPVCTEVSLSLFPSLPLCLPVCVCVSQWFSCHSSDPQTLFHSISLCTSTCVSAFTCMCVSICLLSPPVLSAPLGPVKIKGHFSKGQSSLSERWNVTGVRSAVRWHWTSTHLQPWQLTPLGTSRVGDIQFTGHNDTPLCSLMSKLTRQDFLSGLVVSRWKRDTKLSVRPRRCEPLLIRT